MFSVCIADEPRHPAEHPGALQAGRAGRLLRPQKDGFTHPPLLRQRRVRRFENVFTDVSSVVRLQIIAENPRNYFKMAEKISDIAEIVSEMAGISFNNVA